jgi:hypothetical protein
MPPWETQKLSNLAGVGQWHRDVAYRNNILTAVFFIIAAWASVRWYHSNDHSPDGFIDALTSLLSSCPWKRDA